MTEPKGMFILVEGPDGAGKTTMVKSLAEYLDKLGYDVECIREPGTLSINEQIRSILKDEDSDINDRTELLLFEACRSEFVQKVLAPAIADGKVILCDRYMHSTVAYQGYGRGMDLELIERLNEYTTCGMMPDHAFVLDVPVDVSVERSADQHDRMQAMDLHAKEMIRQAYLDMAQKWDNHHVIDATQPIDRVFNAIADILKLPPIPKKKVEEPKPEPVQKPIGEQALATDFTKQDKIHAEMLVNAVEEAEQAAEKPQVDMGDAPPVVEVEELAPPEGSVAVDTLVTVTVDLHFKLGEKTHEGVTYDRDAFIGALGKGVDETPSGIPIVHVKDGNDVPDLDAGVPVNRIVGHVVGAQINGDNSVQLDTEVKSEFSFINRLSIAAMSNMKEGDVCHTESIIFMYPLNEQGEFFQLG